MQTLPNRSCVDCDNSISHKNFKNPKICWDFEKLSKIVKVENLISEDRIFA